MNPFPFEITFSKFIQSFANPFLDIFFILITLLGNPAFWIIISALLFWKGEEKKSFAITTLVLFSSVLTTIVKPLAGRLRPSPEEFRVISFDGNGLYSMPSTHSAIAGSAYSYFFREKLGTNSILLIMLILVLLSRIYLGVHYLLDVILGALLGIAIGYIVKGIEENFPKVEMNGKRVLQETGVISFLMFGIAVILVFRHLWFAAFFFGYFIGAFLLKLLNFDSEKKLLISKTFFGLAGLGIIVLIGETEFLKPEAYFLSGLWITLLCPLTYFYLTEKGLKQKKEEKIKWPKKTKSNAKTE